MNKKFFISGIVTGVTAFFLGWLIWGILLMKFSESNTVPYPGLVKEEMNLILIFLSNLIWGFTLTWIYSSFSGKKSIQGGAITGLIIGLLYAAVLNLSFHAFWNLYSPLMLVVDTVANAVYSAVLGAVVGAILRTR